MKSRLPCCLPCHLILGNVCLVLLTMAATLLLVSEIHPASQLKASQMTNLKHLFALQMKINIHHRSLN